MPVAGPYRGAVADLTGDGAPSILRLGWKGTASLPGTTLNAILNRGNRQFVLSSAFVVGGAGTQNADGSLNPNVVDIAAGDINGDGAADAEIISSGSAVNVYYGASGGTFLPIPLSITDHGVGASITLGDYIGAGIVSGMLSEGAGSFPDYHMIFNDGRGDLTFFPYADILPGGSLGMTTVRLPGFQHDSVVGVTSDGSIGYAYGGATATTEFSHGVGTSSNLGQAGPIERDGDFQDAMRLPGPLAQGNVGRILSAGDIDGTGTSGFAVASTNGSIYIVKWYGTGANNQQVVATLNLPNGLVPDSVTLAPLAKGNRASVIATTTTAGFYVFLNDGKGNFGPATQIQTPFRVAIEADVVDFDGDGIADVALNDIDNDRVAIFFGSQNNTGAFVSPIGDYTRLVQNANGTYSRIYNDGTVVTFNGNGFQTTIADANGNTTNYSYNGQGQLTSIVDPTGATTTMTYSGAFVASVTDGAGRTTSFQHDGSGNLTQVTDPAGNVTQYLYDANHQLITTIAPTGGATSNTFTSTGQVNKQTYPDGASVSLDVSNALGLNALGVSLGGPTNAAFVPVGSRDTLMQDANGNLMETMVNEWGAVVTVTDALGRVSNFYRDGANRVVESDTPAGVSTGPVGATPGGLTQNGSSDLLIDEYTWDGNGNLLSLHEANGHPQDPVSGSPLDRITTYVYEPVYNKVIQKTDADGYVTKYSYDANGNMLAKTDALGGVLAYTYNSQGLPLTKTDQNGNVTSYAYDTNGNLARTTDALGTFFDRYYDASGNAILTIDATGTSVQRTRATKYDSDNRVIATVSATGQTTSTAYDGNGNVAQFTDAAGNVTTSVYDSLNRLVSVTTPDAGTGSYTYDSNNNRLTATDASGAVSSYVYDAANRVIATTDGIGATRTLTYDLRDDAITVTDARGNTNAFTYDALKRISGRTPPGASSPQFIYLWDRRDNLQGSATPTNGFRLDYGSAYYDGLSRVIAYQDRAYSYDAAGNLLSASSNIAPFSGYHSNFTYDALNRRVSEQDIGDYHAIDQFYSLAFAYDPLSRRASVTDNYNATTSYAYDGEDRLLTLTTPWGQPITQSYDPAGRPLRLAYPNGLDADLSFETATGRLASITHRAGSLAAPVAQFNHTYDIRGDLATLTELNSGTKSFAYDAIERLGAVTQTLPLPATQIEAYAYDTEGNRVASHISLAYVTDGANHVLDDGTNTYTWTPDGGMASRTPNADAAAGVTFQYSWQGTLNQLRLEAVGGAYPISFMYDGLLRNIGRNFADPTRGLVVEHHDGPDIALELRNYFAGSGSQWVRYVHGPGVDQPLALEIYPQGAPPTPGTGAQYYFHADGEGSIRLLTDANAQIANQYSYDSYGQRLTVVESVPQPYGWKGRDFIPGPNIYYNRARFYDPVLGRFTTEDPIGYAAGDWNRYSFAWNNPHNWNDPSGTAAVDYVETALIGAASGAAAGAAGAGVACAFNTIASALELPEFSGNIIAVEPGLCSVGAVIQGAAEGALSGAVSSVGLVKVLNSLPINQKGKIGEALSRILNGLKGSNVEPWNKRIPGYRGLTARPDFVVISATGLKYYIESKFGTAALSDAQKVALDALGPTLFTVEVWSYGLFGAFGGAAGGFLGGLTQSN